MHNPEKKGRKVKRNPTGFGLRKFTCPSCGSWFDRDVASALVIKDKGLCLWNAGETPGDDRVNMMEYKAFLM
ncbi:MAG: hypothetical protein ACP5LX_02465 [Nitrososphaeria archaeon]